MVLGGGGDREATFPIGNGGGCDDGESGIEEEGDAAVSDHDLLDHKGANSAILWANQATLIFEEISV